MQDARNFLTENSCPPNIDPVVTLVFGTGFSKAFSGGATAADWPGLIRTLAGLLPTPKQKKYITGIVEKALGPVPGSGAGAADVSPDTHHYTALLHILRKELGGKWNAVIESTVQQVVDGRKKAVVSAEWKKVLKVISQRAQAGHVRVLSTNFDDLLARELGLKVLLRSGEVFDPVTGSPVPLIAAARPIALRAWGQTDHQSGRLHRKILKDTCGVLHLHGWYRQPKDLVVDPVDYHAAEERVDRLDLAVGLFRSILDSGTAASVFVGVGDGMIDDHFCKIWETVHLIRKARQRILRRGSLYQKPVTCPNLWLLHESEKDKVQKLKRKLPQCEQIICPVSYPSGTSKYDLMPAYLSEILNHYEGNTRAI